MKVEQVGNRTQIRMSVRFVSVDDKDDFIDVTTAGYGMTIRTGPQGNQLFNQNAC